MLYNNNIIIISQLNKLKFAMKNETDVIERLSSNMIRSSNDETNFPHKLLLPKRQVANPCKAFANHTSTDIKFSRAQISKMQAGGFKKFLSPLLKCGLLLLKSTMKPLGYLGLSALGFLSDALIHKK